MNTGFTAKIENNRGWKRGIVSHVFGLKIRMQLQST